MVAGVFWLDAMVIKAYTFIYSRIPASGDFTPVKKVLTPSSSSILGYSQPTGYFYGHFPACVSIIITFILDRLAGEMDQKLSKSDAHHKAVHHRKRNGLKKKGCNPIGQV